MGIRLGPFDPIKLLFGILNLLMQKTVISYEEARIILKDSLDPDMKEEDKETLINSIIKRT